jgi:TctA family transporter
MIHGITPGPALITGSPEIFWGLVMSFWIGNVLLLILNIPMIGIWVRIVQIPYHFLYPSILVFICIGVFSVHNSVFDLYTVIAFGIVGYGLRLLDLPPAPLILGFVLEPLMEQQFRRAMLLARGDFSTFVERPISAVIMVVSLALLLHAARGPLKRAWARRLTAS